MTLDEFQELIRASDPANFARHRLFDEECWIFQESPINTRGDYIQFRSRIADLLDINPRGVAVVGSAKFGWSMSPEKIGAAFDADESDVDIVIVSLELFESVWGQILAAYFNGYEYLRKDHAKNIFAKYVIVRSDMDNKSQYLRDLRIKLLELNKIVSEFIAIENRAKYRIYRDWRDAELYHSKGLAELQGKI